MKHLTGKCGATLYDNIFWGRFGWTSPLDSLQREYQSSDSDVVQYGQQSEGFDLDICIQQNGV
ncbi:hypothetical protein COCOBI_pt-0990 (chloroplast) [Coccomyxa sp. Obi]|nr:hypothetical protein COCOBI_pt-0990 [Coccomyxa sp. Obi]